MKTILSVFMILVFLLAPVYTIAEAQPATLTYYISSSTGSDGNNGLSPGAPLANIMKVNTLALQPGDQVLFKCGDIWRADPLIINRSGSAAASITFGSYPAGCANKPILSGSQPVTGWTATPSANIYQSTLPGTLFPNGLNQLFRAGARLTMGRWPNLDAPKGGYSFIDAHNAGTALITDNELPAGNWTGAILHIKNIRWSMLDRQVESVNGHTLTLNTGLSCLVESWGTCAGWGYFINNALSTLDQDGEWYYDTTSHILYMVSTSGPPNKIEGSVVLGTGDIRSYGGIVLSAGSPTAYVVIDNLAAQNWFNDGIGSPAGGMANNIYHDITVKNVSIKDPNDDGVNLSTWLQNPTDKQQGLYGGYNLLFQNNVIDGANAFGVTGYFASSIFENNLIENVALVKNLNASAMGCGLDTGECTENGDGFRIRLYKMPNGPIVSGYGNVLRQNFFEKIGYNGVDVFGPETTLEENFIHQSCYTKADCGGVRVFGDSSIAATTVYNVHLIDNIIMDIPGNVDGCEVSRAAFGMGLYIDYYSRNVEARGNTVINTTADGILFQNSTGQVVDNTVYNASSGTEFSSQIDVSGSVSSVSLANNVMVGLTSNAWTLYVSSVSNLTSSDYNTFFHAYVSKAIAYGGSWTRATFAQWQALSGMDTNSKTNWFTQPAGEATRTRIYFNSLQVDQTFDLGSRQYLTLDQKPEYGSLTLKPFTSAVLVDNGLAPLTLMSITPGLVRVSGPGFTLHLSGTGFTSTSVVRWNGVPRPTTLNGSSSLSATISAADINTAGKATVTVWDPDQGKAGFETPALYLSIVSKVINGFLPDINR